MLQCFIQVALCPLHIPHRLSWYRILPSIVRSRWRFPCLFQYTFALLLIFLLEAMVGVMSFLYEPHVADELYLNLNKTFIENYKVDGSKTRAIDLMQIEVVFWDSYINSYVAAIEQCLITWPAPHLPWDIMLILLYASLYSSPVFQSFCSYEWW